MHDSLGNKTRAKRSKLGTSDRLDFFVTRVLGDSDYKLDSLTSIGLPSRLSTSQVCVALLLLVYR